MHGHEPEDLLRDVAWVRRLARHLAGSAAAADDLAGDALLAWAAAAAPPRSARGWLATVLRHRAHRRHRRDLLRERGERATARPEALPAADEAIARTELHRAVVDAVLALAEPYRSAVVLRFLEELPLNEVAARLSVPTETARTRIKRGVEQLRQRLDRRYGDRAAWAALLVPLAPTSPTAPSRPQPAHPHAAPTSTTLPLGALLMGTKSLFVGAAVAVAAVTWLLLPREPAPQRDERLAAAAGTEPRAATAPHPDTKTAAVRAAIDAAGPEPAADTPPAALVRGRAIDEASRLPLPGATVAWLPLENSPLAATTATADADGRFELTAADADLADRAALLLRAPDHALTVQALGNPADAAASPRIFDVGDVLLPPGTSIEGTVADHLGTPAGDVPLFACLLSYWTSDGRLVRLTQAQPVGRTRADGTFRLDDRLLPNRPPPLLVAAGPQGVGWVDLDDLRRDRSDARTAITLLPPCRQRVRVVDEHGVAVAGARVVAEPRFSPLGMPGTWPIRVENVPGLAAAFVATTGDDGTAVVAPLAVPAAGTRYTLRVEAKGRAQAVVPLELPRDEVVDIVLPRLRPLRLHGRVHDANGAAIAGARVVADWLERAEAASDDQGRFALELPRGDGPLRVLVRARGWFDVRQTLQPDAAADDAPFDVAMRPATELLGRIVDQHGAPVRRANVWRDGGDAQSIASDREGTFRMAVPPADRALLHVAPPEPASAWGRSVDHVVEPGQQTVTIVLERLPPARADLEVELVDTRGGPLEARRATLERRGDGRGLAHPATAVIGRVTASDLPPGEWTIDVDAATGCSLSHTFTVPEAGGSVRLRLEQPLAGEAQGEVVPGNVDLPPDAIVELSFVGPAARFVAADAAGAGNGRTLRLAARGTMRFTIVDVDPTRPLRVLARCGDAIGEAEVRIPSGGRETLRIALTTAGTLRLMAAGPHAQDRVLLQLRRPGGDWGEVVAIEGLRGATGPFELPIAPGPWQWRIALPTRGADNRGNRWHEGTFDVAPGAAATIDVPR